MCALLRRRDEKVQTIYLLAVCVTILFVLLDDAIPRCGDENTLWHSCLQLWKYAPDD